MRLLKRGHLLWILSCCLLAVMLVSTGTVKAVEEEFISGTVAAATKDSSGKVTAVKIVTDKADYAVANNAAAQELLKLVDSEVDVTGKVVVKDNKKTITVSEFDVVAE
jgi:hypothetical protein